MACDSLNLKDLECLSVRLCAQNQLTEVQIHMLLYVVMLINLKFRSLLETSLAGSGGDT